MLLIYPHMRIRHVREYEIVVYVDAVFKDSKGCVRGALFIHNRVAMCWGIKS